MSDDEPLGPPPSETKGDVAQALVRAAASSVPVFGGAAAELIGLVIEPVLERRREEWFRDLGTVVDELRERLDGFDPKRLEQNELFVTAVISASNAALRTHEKEKRTALRNAVVSSALELDIDEHIQLTFIRYVDELTALHLRLLAYLRDPPGWFDRHGIQRPNITMGPRTSILEAALPDLAAESTVYQRAAGDLGARGLIENSLSGMVSQQGLYDRLTTPLGNRFLDYIGNSPDEGSAAAG
jgi:hypothetical protein